MNDLQGWDENLKVSGNEGCASTYSSILCTVSQFKNLLDYSVYTQEY